MTTLVERLLAMHMDEGGAIIVHEAASRIEAQEETIRLAREFVATFKHGNYPEWADALDALKAALADTGSKI